MLCKLLALCAKGLTCEDSGPPEIHGTVAFRCVARGRTERLAHTVLLRLAAGVIANTLPHSGCIASLLVSASPLPNRRHDGYGARLGQAGTSGSSAYSLLSCCCWALSSTVCYHEVHYQFMRVMVSTPEHTPVSDGTSQLTSFTRLSCHNAVTAPRAQYSVVRNYDHPSSVPPCVVVYRLLLPALLLQNS